MKRVSFNAYSRDQLKNILVPRLVSVWSYPKVERLRGEGALEAFEDKAGV